MNSVDVSGFTTKVFHYETFRLAAKWDGILLLRDSTEPELGHCVTGNNKQKIQTTAILSKRWVMALYLRTFCGIKFNRSRTQGKHRGVVLKSHPVLAHRLGDRADRIGHRIQGLCVRNFAPAVCSVGNLLPLTSALSQSLTESLPLISQRTTAAPNHQTAQLVKALPLSLRT